MKARLPITQRALLATDFIPLAPYMILEDEGRVLFYEVGYGRAELIARPRLEDVTAEDVRAVLLLPEQEAVYLSEIRQLPSDDMFSPELLKWLREWWIETVAELRDRQKIGESKTERVA